MPTSLSENLERLAQLPAPPLDEGQVEGLVLRPRKGERLVVEKLHLTPDGGIEGDRWGLRKHRSRNRQVSAIRFDVLRCLAGEEDMALSGDNLHLSLDLSEANLPVGSELQVGQVQFRVSPEHHAPCGQFSDRFGQSAHDATLTEAWRPLRGRGVLLEVIRGGSIAVGDRIRVIRR